MTPSKDNDRAPANRRAFWDQHPGLVWSNRNAPDDAFISAALRQGRFLQLLDIAAEFGLARLQKVWQMELANEDLPPKLVERVTEHLAIFKEANDRAATTGNRKTVGTS